MRARKCLSGVCTTAAVYDYRYEGGMISTNIFDWFVIVAPLRILGQIYMWSRLILLWCGCYAARSAERRFAASSILRKCLITTRTLFIIPSQVIIYGAMFPILCYVLARRIDSPAMHDYVADQYCSVAGQFKIDPEQFIQTSTMLMRNVWPLALVIHLLIMFRTSRCWSWTYGIVGICEFWISIVSALTTIAHYRLLSFRNSNVMDVSIVADNYDFAVLRARRFHFFDGVYMSQSIDLKMLVAALFVMSVLLATLGVVLRYGARMKSAQMHIWKHSFASFAARELWSGNALAVAWNSNVITTGVVNHAVGVHVVSATGKQTTTRTCLQHLTLPDQRASDVHALIFLMNLCMLTEPVTFWRARIGTGVDVALVKSTCTGLTHMIPYRVFLEPDNHADVMWDEIELIKVINSKKLRWSDLLRCG
ncbi:TPA: hypothetical protein N0F65_011574 [Lagenidium giganteum]|uniref:Gustatory receptor n=1 Tax=Lagenidium giganteum TaxID=4803 RepID=A0AAV2YLR0_9STRA|nr:TPA: hypothetical protein N0F65_011574 [Lagenidium giganteum]